MASPRAWIVVFAALAVSSASLTADAAASDPDHPSAPLVRTKRQYDCRYKPNGLRYRCNSGSCIDVDRVCDGARDCDDGSDETRTQCSSNLACPGLSFRCDYGACVDADAKCNGVGDCADGSDEHPRICNRGQQGGGQWNNGNGQGNNGNGQGNNGNGQWNNGNGQWNNGNNGNGRPQNRPPGLGLANNPPTTSGCRGEEYRCANGQCVDNTVVCDGRKDCRDGSDETYTQCYSVKCPSYSFRCTYGGCIDRESRCDGLQHCADGSDEDGCSGSSSGSGSGSGSSVDTRPPTQRPTQRPPATQKPKPTQKPRPTAPATSRPPVATGGPQCRLPQRHTGGAYKVDGCPAGDTSAVCRAVPDTAVPHATVLKYSCEPGYTLNSDTNFTFCLSGVWSPDPPVCAKICPPLISTSVDIECTLDGKPVRCDRGQLPGTRAKLQCKPSYRFPAGVTPDYDAVNCQPDGTWDWPLFKCAPECGVAIAKGQTLIVHGSEANIGDFPWHAGIYDKEQKAGITQVCGGSLVLPNLVVSAAHCFYDDSVEQKMPASRYKVAVGKYFRDWDHPEQGVVQKADVFKIHLPDKYRGKSRNYAEDIALVELTVHVSISAVVMPICVDWLGSTLHGLRRGDVGTVVGWGRTEDRSPSATLLSARLPYVAFDDCLREIPDTFRPYITSDKFCAGNINGSAVAKGDSGGGLAFKDKTAWFLRGIVSAGVPNSLTYSAFTNVDYHKQWMSSVRAEAENRKNQQQQSRRG